MQVAERAEEGMERIKRCLRATLQVVVRYVSSSTVARIHSYADVHEADCAGVQSDGVSQKASAETYVLSRTWESYAVAVCTDHPDQDVRPFNCKDCNKAFARRYIVSHSHSAQWIDRAYANI